MNIGTLNRTVPRALQDIRRVGLSSCVAISCCGVLQCKQSADRFELCPCLPLSWPCLPTRLLSMQFPRESSYLIIKHSGPQNYLSWSSSPHSSIIIRYLDPMGSERQHNSIFCVWLLHYFSMLPLDLRTLAWMMYPVDPNNPR